MNKTIAHRWQNSEIGTIHVAAGISGLCIVDLLGSQEPPVNSQESTGASSQADEIADFGLRQILEYLQGKRRNFDLPIDWSAITAFQKRVLEFALQIPFGETCTYGQVAVSIGNANASRAVGAALGRNPMPIIIPCHRVVAANGHLTGFSAADGIRTKQWLLQLEGHKIVAQKLD